MQANMKSRKELNREYLERPKPAGVFQVKNTANGKVLLGSSLNLNGALNGHKFTLKIGSHRNKALQEDWARYGAEAFVFEILEVVQVSDDPKFNLSDELTLLEMIWLEKLQPFAEKGYNLNSNIRQA
jgi:group I intron endonuclease